MNRLRSYGKNETNFSEPFHEMSIDEIDESIEHFVKFNEIETYKKYYYRHTEQHVKIFKTINGKIIYNVHTGILKLNEVQNILYRNMALKFLMSV